MAGRRLSIHRLALLLALLLGLPFAAQAQLSVVSGPTLTMNPNGTTPLAGVVEATTSVPATASLSVTSADHSFDVEFDDYTTEHYLPVLGLKADGTYAVEVTFRSYGGDEATPAPMQAVTAPLPADLPTIEVLTSQPALMEPGFTLLDRYGWTGPDPGPRYTLVFDAAGDVVWYGSFGGGATLKQSNGYLVWQAGSQMQQRDFLGNELPRVDLAAPSLHHDFFPTEYGTFLSLTRRVISVAGYPTSDTDPDAPTQTADVRDEPVVEFAADGSLLNEWPLADIIDPTRIGYNSLSLLGDGSYDWSHANAVLHDPRDDSIIVSVRHQDAVIKFIRATGELKWILGPHANWKPEFQPFLLQPVGALEWQYHEHAPMLTPNGNLLLFDNHNLGASPFDGTEPQSAQNIASRAVEYAIDEENMQVTQVWEYGPPPAVRLYSGFISDADWMPQTGNVLVNFGGCSFTGGVANSDQGLGDVHPRVVEVTHDTPPVVVFDLRVYDPGHRMTAYRAERIASLYPGGYVECNDGVDNDQDGFVDAVDVGCQGDIDDSERTVERACDDGVDNDLDGLVDTRDPGCVSPRGRVEDPPCDDGLDNDGDTFIDFDDPQCRPDWVLWEAPPPPLPACGLGFELAPILALLLGWRRRAAHARALARD